MRFRHGVRNLLALALLWTLSGCAGATRDLANSIIPAFRAESGIYQTLADLDEQIQSTSTSREAVEAWRKKRDEMRLSIQTFHAALSTVAAILLGGK